MKQLGTETESPDRKMKYVLRDPWKENLKQMTKCILRVFEFSWLVLPEWRQRVFPRHQKALYYAVCLFFSSKKVGKCQ